MSIRLSIRPRTALRAQRGLTMIELMISITIGLVVVGAVTYMYIGSKGAYRGNESQARIQEAGRFALDAITNDIRRAGGLGCGTLESVYTGANLSVNVIPPALAGVSQIAIGSAVNPAVLTVDTNSQPIPIQGLTIGPTYPQPPTTAPAGWTAPASAPLYRGGDILQLQIASGVPVRVVSNPDVVNGNFQIASNTITGTSAPNFNQYDFVVLANCSSAAVFQTPSTPTGSPPVMSYKVGGTVPTLIQSQQLGFGIGSYATVQHFDQVTYYLGTLPGSANAVGGTSSSALYRYSLAAGAAEEVADNVEDIDVSYGVGSGATVFKSANAMTAADWPNVVSVRVSLMAVGYQFGIASGSTPQAFAFHGAGTAATPVTWTAPDNRLRQVFTVTATLRDRLQ